VKTLRSGRGVAGLRDLARAKSALADSALAPRNV
jgi:hypothetical protein